MKFTLDNTALMQDEIPGSEKIITKLHDILKLLSLLNFVMFFVVLLMSHSQNCTRIKLIRKLSRKKETKKWFGVNFKLFWAPLFLVMLYYLNFFGWVYRSVSQICLRIKGSEKVQDIGRRGLHGILDWDYIGL